MRANREQADTRKNQLIETALTLAESVGYKRATRAAIARKSGVSMPTVQHYLGNKYEIRELILAEAKRHKRKKILQDYFSTVLSLTSAKAKEVVQLVLKS